jgi:hypothetical protein
MVSIKPASMFRADIADGTEFRFSRDARHTDACWRAGSIVLGCWGAIGQKTGIREEDRAATDLNDRSAPVTPGSTPFVNPWRPGRSYPRNALPFLFS